MRPNRQLPGCKGGQAGDAGCFCTGSRGLFLIPWRRAGTMRAIFKCERCRCAARGKMLDGKQMLLSTGGNIKLMLVAGMPPRSTFFCMF